MGDQVRLSEIVQKEAMLWGDAAGEAYHEPADVGMDLQWDTFLSPLLKRHEVSLRVTLDLACGRGRNTLKLLECGAERVVAVDVNPENIDQCMRRFTNEPVVCLINNGFDLSGLDMEQFTLVYSWDAMVHFDLLIVASYLPEFYRVLEAEGICLIHHSNFSGRPGADFLTNPHARNFMSADIFRHLAIRSGFECVEQSIIQWGSDPGLDCISVLRKRR
jgi:ubiquinone/menaquinone biosynthesis C-methylase UbiE